MCWNMMRDRYFICWRKKAYLKLKEKRLYYMMEELGESIIGSSKKIQFYNIHLAGNGQTLRIRAKKFKNFNVRLFIPPYQDICGPLGDYNISFLLKYSKN